MVAILEFPSTRLEFSVGVQLRGFSKHKRLLNPSAPTSSRKFSSFTMGVLFSLLGPYSFGFLLHSYSNPTRFIMEIQCHGDIARQSLTMKNIQSINRMISWVTSDLKLVLPDETLFIYRSKQAIHFDRSCLKITYANLAIITKVMENL